MIRWIVRFFSFFKIFVCLFEYIRIRIHVTNIDNNIFQLLDLGTLYEFAFLSYPIFGV